LNALEPSTPIKAVPQAAPAPIPADENLPDISQQEPFQQASLTEGEPVVEPPPPVTAPPVSQEAPPPVASKADPRQMISPDSALPPAVAQIESEAFAGSPEAQHDLAAIYTAGHAGVAQDYERAAFWFTRAAEGGIPNARYNLGVLYHQGLGVKSDLSKAIYWYQEAARVGHAEAQYNLGIAHIEGIGVSYDPEEAARNFESAARLGVVEAAYNLGLIYENGLLGQSKPDEAMMWYKHAADKGSPEARAALDQLARSIGVAPQDVGKIAGQVSTMNAAHASIPNANPDDNQVLVAQIQEYLMRSGLYPGPADGINGPLTRDAVRSYQALNDIRVDGVITQELLSHMLANTQDYRNVLVDDGVGSRAQ
jgi:TPR repeat protein